MLNLKKCWIVKLGIFLIVNLSNSNVERFHTILIYNEILILSMLSGARMLATLIFSAIPKTQNRIGII